MPFDVTAQIEPWFWVAVALIMLTAEIFTGGLYLIPLSAGAGSAALVAFASNQGMPVQIVVFCIVTIIMFFALRPLAERATVSENSASFNVDRLIGMPALVTQTIDPVQSLGQVRVARELWRAESQDQTVIPADTQVVVRQVEGNHLIVSAPPPSVSSS